MINDIYEILFMLSLIISTRIKENCKKLSLR